MLDELTRRGREGFERHGLLKAGEVSQEKLNAALRAGGEDPEAIARLRKRKGREAAKKRAATIAKNGKKQSATTSWESRG